MSKTLTIEEFIATASYKKGAKHFPSPQRLVDILTTVIKNISHSTTIVVDKEGGAVVDESKPNAEDIVTWGRGYIIFELEDTVKLGNMGDLNTSVGIIWSYDTTREMVKIFMGARISACTNLSIFGEEASKEFMLGGKIRGKTDKEKSKYWSRKIEDLDDNMIDWFETNLANRQEKLEATADLLKSMHDTVYTGNKVDALIGGIYLDLVIPNKLDYSIFNYACQMIFDKTHWHKMKEVYCNTKFYTDGFMDRDGKSCRIMVRLWDFYGAMTQKITDGEVDVDKIVDKTIDIGNAILPYIQVLEPTQLEKDTSDQDKIPDDDLPF